MREVRALIGFTRLDAPDPEDPMLVTRVGLARDAPTWVPASEVRGARQQHSPAGGISVRSAAESRGFPRCVL
ncbi:MAG: hypothetical protein DLM60_02545 [Pseudonocardiales bacterium]|nr:hypothetical protein [Actinomycetota bacterium]PZS23490.1 MAG: hypothetical protein DLM60_02545 [Pseudonocardiales bacterium]